MGQPLALTIKTADSGYVYTVEAKKKKRSARPEGPRGGISLQLLVTAAPTSSLLPQGAFRRSPILIW